MEKSSKTRPIVAINSHKRYLKTAIAKLIRFLDVKSEGDAVKIFLFPVLLTSLRNRKKLYFGPHEIERMQAEIEYRLELAQGVEDIWDSNRSTNLPEQLGPWNYRAINESQEKLDSTSGMDGVGPKIYSVPPKPPRTPAAEKQPEVYGEAAKGLDEKRGRSKKRKGRNDSK